MNADTTLYGDESGRWQLHGHKANRYGERPILYWVEVNHEGRPMRKVRNPRNVNGTEIRTPERSSQQGEFSRRALENLYMPISVGEAQHLLEAAK